MELHHHNNDSIDSFMRHGPKRWIEASAESVDTKTHLGDTKGLTGPAATQIRMGVCPLLVVETDRLQSVQEACYTARELVDLGLRLDGKSIKEPTEDMEQTSAPGRLANVEWYTKPQGAQTLRERVSLAQWRKRELLSQHSK